MAPEVKVEGLMIEGAAAIARELLAVQEGTIRAAREAQHAELGGIRARMGFAEPEAVEPDTVVDTRIADKTPVVTPEQVMSVIPLTARAATTTEIGRKAISDIIHHRDDRMLAIVGPCSIHNAEEALAYARQVAQWRKQYGDSLEIVMRMYGEKPRTELGWKGLTYDPFLNGTDDINTGLVLTRMLASQTVNMGVPIAMERLNPNTPQYTDGLVSYDAIGARNATDQASRERASGSSSPVGIKNTPDGNIAAAVEAAVAVRAPHTFLGLRKDGFPMEVRTSGNSDAHIILRGGTSGPNYHEESVRQAVLLLGAKQLPISVVVDASHGNSGKIAANQLKVIESVAHQVRLGQSALVGVMIESNLRHGNQSIGDGMGLTEGVSVTDECVDMHDTTVMLELLAAAVVGRRKRNERE